MNLTQQVAWQAVVKNPELWSAFVEFCETQAREALTRQDEEALDVTSGTGFSDRVLGIIRLTAERHVYSELPRKFLDEINKAGDVAVTQSRGDWERDEG